MSYTLKDIERAAKAIAQHGTKQAAAKALGIPVSTLKSRLKLAARKGLLPFTPSPMEGFEIAQVSAKEGDAWVKQKPEHGEVFQLPKGHVLKGVSALIDSDGREIAKWVKSREGVDSVTLVDAVKLAMAEYKGVAPLIAQPKTTDAELLTLYPIADHHLGMYAWGAETGADYDLHIARDLLINSATELVRSSPASETAVVLNLGDFLHADNSKNMTPASGHILDVDTRFAKVLSLGVDLMRAMVQLALQKHKRVHVRMLPGNHDPHVAVALAIALEMFFHNEPRVIVDKSPSLFWFMQFGSTMLAAHHGHEVKPAHMPGVMAAREPKIWGKTINRYAFLGHFHHTSMGEENGARWEVLNTLAARDAYSAGKGYTSGRSMKAVTFHKTRGELCRITRNVD